MKFSTFFGVIAVISFTITFCLGVTEWWLRWEYGPITCFYSGCTALVFIGLTWVAETLESHRIRMEYIPIRERR